MFGRKASRPASDSLDWHVDFIADLARLLRPGVYVELGIFQAELFNRVAPFAELAIGLDIDPASARYVRRAPNVEFICGTTDSFVSEMLDRDLVIDMLFIDADHSRESVLADFRNYFPFVRPQGLILLHDTHPGNEGLTDAGWCGDAYRAIEELQRNADEYEMMTIPRSPGLTMCRKRTAQLSWMEPPVTDRASGGCATP